MQHNKSVQNEARTWIVEPWHPLVLLSTASSLTGPNSSTALEQAVAGPKLPVAESSQGKPCLRALIAQDQAHGEGLGPPGFRQKMQGQLLRSIRHDQRGGEKALIHPKSLQEHQVRALT